LLRVLFSLSLGKSESELSGPGSLPGGPERHTGQMNVSGSRAAAASQLGGHSKTGEPTFIVAVLRTAGGHPRVGLA
jgi:hypothetical protein